VTSSGRACLADFGLSAARDTQQTSTRTSHMAGTTRWQAPELIGIDLAGAETGTCTTRASDIYSLGCVFYEVCTSKLIITHQLIFSITDILRKNSISRA
jgi:serine/threonine protein kinase